MNQFEVALNSFKWLDYTNPSSELLKQIAKDLGLLPHLLENCLDTDYLPQIETYGPASSSVQFIILRLMEPDTKLNANSVQSLTTKIALFVTDKVIVSIHRLELKEIVAIQESIKNLVLTDLHKSKLMSLFYEQVSFGFDKPLSELEQNLDQFEDNFFNKRKSKVFLQEGFYLKRKASAFKKVLKLSLDLMTKLTLKMDCGLEHFQESKDRLERSLFYAEDVHENIQSLLNLHMSIESQKTNEASFKTNEIMRVLTVLTIFFLPLNFIVGMFGMNFTHIPLLQHEYGFWLSVAAMFFVSMSLGVYLLKQGWLRKPKIATGKNQ